jgi:hypothetical protein
MSTSRGKTSGAGLWERQESVNEWFRCPSYCARTGESYTSRANVGRRRGASVWPEKKQMTGKGVRDD